MQDFLRHSIHRQTSLSQVRFPCRSRFQVSVGQVQARFQDPVVQVQVRFQDPVVQVQGCLRSPGPSTLGSRSVPSTQLSPNLVPLLPLVLPLV